MRIISTRFLAILTCLLYILIVFYCYHFFATQQTDDESLNTKQKFSTKLKTSKIESLRMEMTKNNIQDQQVEKNNNLPKKTENEFNDETTIENTFHSIIHSSFYVFSIYEDQRDSTKGKLIFLIYKQRANPQLWCHYLNPNETPPPPPQAKTVVYPMTDLRGNKGKFYELCENHNQQFGGYFGVCEMPNVNGTKDKLFVTLSSDANNAISSLPTLPVHRMINNHDGLAVVSTNTSWKLGLCVPTLFGKVNHKELFEFFTVIKSLGIDHVTMYVDFTTLSNEVKSVLKYFEKSDYLFVIPWKLPGGGMGGSNWNYAQILNVNDCLYRSMNKYEYVAFHDIDEFIVPRGNLQNIKQLVEKYWKIEKNLCGICLKSVFFTPAMEINENKNFRILASQERTPTASNVRTKCLVKPKRIYEMGIHHISKPYQEYFVNIKVDERDALLHHYRKCLSDFGMNCYQYIHDNSLVTFFQQANVQQKWQNYSASGGA